MTVTYRNQSNTSTQRDAWIEINLSALERNFKKISEITKTGIMAVVKADAYGHGATALAPILQSLNIKSFGVATVDEGVSLRNCGIKIPIIILGATPFWAYETCVKNNLTITIYSSKQITQLKDTLANLKLSNLKIPVQIKIDTGMNRLGIDFKEAKSIINEIRNLDFLEIKGIFSHLSDANNHKFSLLQKERFDSVINSLNDLQVQKHLANSHAAINYPDFRYDLVRVGIALYGQEFNFLEPIISLKGRITEIHKVLKDEYVSYERLWKAQKDSVIATIPIGYADGIDRKLSNKIFGSLKGQKINQVGNITMDQMMFDVTELNAEVNDVITLLDDKNPISNWANILGTLTYELVCRLKLRLPRIYTRD